MEPACERCKVAPRKIGRGGHPERYCKDCRKIVLREMAESGYLTPKPRITTDKNGRHSEHDLGGSGSSFDNIVKAWEEG